MKQNAAYGALWLLLMMTGCGLGFGEKTTTVRIQEAPSPTCSSDSMCRVKMEAAQIWITNNTTNRIRLATSALIQTEASPDKYTTELEFIVKKQITENGVYKIVIGGACNNIFRCRMSGDEINKSFYEFVANYGSQQ